MRGTRGLRPALNPIIVKELRTRMRGVRPYAILTVFLVLLALAGTGIYQVMLQQSRFGGTLLSAQVGQSLFRGLAFVELLLVVFLAPAMTSGAISGEREQLTYDMLIATPLRPAQILSGKLVAALSYLFLLIFASIPVFSVVLLFGGVELRALLKTLALLLAATLFFGTVGLFCSALMRRTARATTVAYTIVLILVGVPVLVASVWGQFTTPPGQQAPPWLVYLNPFSALMSVTTIAVGGDPTMSSMPIMGFGDPFGGVPLLAIFSPGVLYYGPNGPVIIPIYRATMLAYALLTLLLCWLSAHMVLPNRRWRPRWSDLGFAALTLALLALIIMTQAWWLVEAPKQF
jgi:ABC-type transport system involved in multi-copper enzyme maturation permease subunit